MKLKVKAVQLLQFIHVWNMNVKTKCCGNPSSSCSHISLKTTNVNHMVALEEIHPLRIMNAC